MEKRALVVLEGKKIRKTWHDDEWWFVLEDIVLALIDSKDPKQYLQRMKQRDESLAKGWVQIVHTLQITTEGGRQSMNCVNREGAFRIIQSIPSPRAEPFKLWLAKLGCERVQEIENSELAHKRIKKTYKQKGYSNDWIEKRVRGISVRQELTNEWKTRRVKKNTDFAILTNEISKATFGKTVEEYKAHKNLEKQNLRDHMTDLELILTMLREATTTKLTKERDSKKFTKLKKRRERWRKCCRINKKRY